MHELATNSLFLDNVYPIMRSFFVVIRHKSNQENKFRTQTDAILKAGLHTQIHLQVNSSLYTSKAAFLFHLNAIHLFPHNEKRGLFSYFLPPLNL
jgi:hypothetical protein